jgi:predicted TIM-barrel fold metal-dependent hydrolase
MAGGPASALLAELALVDAHCHPLVATAIDGQAFERFCTEADRPPPEGGAWDSPAGLAIRRWCAPLLDLEPHAPPARYLERRVTLGVEEVHARLMGGTRLSHLLVDTGLRGPNLGGLDFLGRAAGAPVAEVVRLERVAEELADAGVDAGQFAGAYAERLASVAADAVAVKSILAYRHGLDVDPGRPDAANVRGAAEQWLADAEPGRRRRLDHPVLLRFVLWAGVDLGLPIQVHTGFGDPDLRLHRSDPSLLQPLLAALEPAGVPVVLLHAYPYHRQAGWLAAVYPHVYLDVGLTVGQVGGGAGAVLAECLELAPFSKILFSTDGYRLAELYLIGAAGFRSGLGQLLDRRVADGVISLADAERAARMIGVENAHRVYRLSRAHP